MVIDEPFLLVDIESSKRRSLNLQEDSVLHAPAALASARRIAKSKALIAARGGGRDAKQLQLLAP
jgi:hypothetical protein